MQHKKQESVLDHLKSSVKHFIRYKGNMLHSPNFLKLNIITALYIL